MIRPATPVPRAPARRRCARAAAVVCWAWLALGGPALARADSAADDPPPSPAEAFEEEVDEEIDPLFGDDFLDVPSGYPDPAEKMNRGILRFNLELDRWIFDPITRAYQFVVPDVARRAIRRVFLNLNSPPILANDLLQLEWQDAGVTLGRFVINSTIGVAGIFEVAEPLGLPRHESDFGQTLRLADVESGPYLVVPILGPSTVRDATGEIVDSFFSPSTYFFGFGFGQQILTSGPLTEQLVYTGTSGLSTRSYHYESLKALKESSVDFYSAMRSAFYQNREAEIWDRRRDRENDWTVPY